MPNLLLERIDSQLAQRMCFVLMPFKSDFKNIYKSINSVARECGLECLRADEIRKSSQIIRDIWEKINESRFVIADLSGCNPNVFYELGLAHAIQKTVILLVQDTEKDVPFDISGIRHIRYAKNRPAEFKKKLKETVKATIPTIPKDFNPIGGHDSEETAEPHVILTGIEVPPFIKLGQSAEILLKAKNIGEDTQEAYFSISFPFGIDDIEILGSNTATQKGKKDETWCNGEMILSYPIAEGLKYRGTWGKGVECYLKVKISPFKKGFVWFYVNASSFSVDKKWIQDPHDRLIDVDQRKEPVYCGIIDVI